VPSNPGKRIPPTVNLSETLKRAGGGVGGALTTRGRTAHDLWTNSRRATHSEHQHPARPPQRRPPGSRLAPRHLREMGMTAELIPLNGGHPMVYGPVDTGPEPAHGPLYGHYDVQPVDPLAEWTSPHSSPPSGESTSRKGGRARVFQIRLEGLKDGENLSLIAARARGRRGPLPRWWARMGGGPLCQRSTGWTS